MRIVSNRLPVESGVSCFLFAPCEGRKKDDGLISQVTFKADWKQSSNPRCSLHADVF